MPLALQFIKGSLDGRRFAVGAEPVLVGRSHSCGVRPSEPDVSGRHLVASAAGDVLAVQVLSGHRTQIDGRPVPKGDTVAVSPGSVVELGSTLAFRVAAEDAADDCDTAVQTGETGLVTGTGRPAPAGVSGSTVGSRATSVMTSATVAPGTRTEFGTGTAFTVAGATSVATGEFGTTGQESGETQVLQTQAVSREELEELKKLFDAKKSRKTASKFAIAGIAAAAALGVSLWASTREPERQLALPKANESLEWKVVQILPALDPGPGKTEGSVSFRYPHPAAAAVSAVSTNSFGGKSIGVRTFIGRNRDVELDLAVDVFRYPEALNESRAATFRRYLEKSGEMFSAIDNCVPLSDEDFFGGNGGLRRAVPCSRMAYWLTRGKQSVFGIVSFFRSGDLCCAFRREVPATEQLRAERIMQNTRAWLFQDKSGAFGASQWEGASGAGCSDPALVLSRCQSAFDLDTPSEWPEIEAGLRNVLVETSCGGGTPEMAGRAISLLKDLRARKVRHWKSFVAARVPLAASADKRGDDSAARALDRAVREAYSSPDEEWHFLARRTKWWNR